MINKSLITKKKKIFLINNEINLDNFSNDEKLTLIQTLYSTCKHGTEHWIIKEKAHWIKYKREQNSNFFTNKVYKNSKENQLLGNMFVGKILKISAKNKKYKKNDIVLGYGGCANFQTIKLTNIICKVKKNVPVENYLCFDPIEFSIGAIRDSNIKFGDNIGVVGLGAIGLITVMLLKKSFANTVVGVDQSFDRLKLAKKIGANIVLNNKFNTIEKYRTKLNPTGLDMVIDFSGSVSGLNTAISLSKYNGTVISGSMYPPANSKLELGKEFHWNNIQIMSSRISNEPHKDHPAWNRSRLHKLIIGILEKNDVNFKNIIHKIYPFKSSLAIYKKNMKDNKILKLTFKH